MRALKKTYPAFATSDRVQTEKFLSLLQGGRNDKIFTDKFFETIEKRRADLGKLQQTLFLLQLPTFAYLVLVLAGIDVNLSILGIAAGKNLRELLVVVSAVLGLWITWVTSEKSAIDSMLKARNYRIAKGDREKLQFLNAGYGLNPFLIVDPIDPYWSRGWLHVLSLIIFVIAILVMVAVLAIFGLAVHVYTLVEVYRHPNFSHGATLGDQRFRRSYKPRLLYSHCSARRLACAVSTAVEEIPRAHLVDRGHDRFLHRGMLPLSPIVDRRFHRLSE